MQHRSLANDEAIQILHPAHRRCIFAISIFTTLGIMIPLSAATTSAPTTTPTASTRPTIINATLLSLLVAENTKTIGKIRNQQYRADETEAAPPRNPERAFHADVVKEGTNAWWRMQIPLKNGTTGVTDLATFLVIRTNAGAMMWHENTAQATMHEADADGALPKFTQEYVIQTQKPVDVLEAVAAQGDGPLAKSIQAFSTPPRSISAERDAKDPNICYITMFGPEFEGPKGQAVLDAGKGYLMTKLTYFRHRLVAHETQVEVERIGTDRLWFPTSYESIEYGRNGQKSVTHSQTSRLSNVELNEQLPPDAFENSRLNFPDGLQVDIRSFTGTNRLMVWFKGALLTEDAYMAKIIAARRPANPNAPAIRP